MKNINYSLLPEHIREGMKLWIEDGLLPGDFLQAVLRDKLIMSFATADHINTFYMKDIAAFMWTEAPADCWGSEARIQAWKGLKKMAQD